MTRREFITLTAAATGSLIARPGLAQPAPIPRPQPKIPRWRGFNLTEMNGGPRGGRPYRESDFQWDGRSGRPPRGPPLTLGQVEPAPARGSRLGARNEDNWASPGRAMSESRWRRQSG